MKTVRRPPYPKWNPGYFPCSSLTPPSAFLTPSIGVLRWIRANRPLGHSADLRTHLPHDGDPCELCTVLRDVLAVIQGWVTRESA